MTDADAGRENTRDAPAEAFLDNVRRDYLVALAEALKASRNTEESQCDDS